MNQELQQSLDDILSTQNREITALYNFKAMNKIIKDMPSLRNFEQYKVFKDNELDITNTLLNSMRGVTERLSHLTEDFDFGVSIIPVTYFKEDTIKIIREINDSTSYEPTNTENEKTNLIKVFINDRIIRNELRLLDRGSKVDASPIEEKLDTAIDNAMINKYQITADKKFKNAFNSIKEDVVVMYQMLEKGGFFDITEDQNDEPERTGKREPK